MKKMFLLMSMFSLYTGAMECNKSPSIKPDEKSKDLRVAVMNQMLKAVAGDSDSYEYTTDTINPALLEQSPRSFLKDAAHEIKNDFWHYLISEGIATKDLIHSLMPLAIDSKNRRSEEYQVKHSNLDGPLVEEINAVRAELGISSSFFIKKAQDDIPASIIGNVVLVNEEKLQEIAPTPRSRNVVWKHEFSHHRNGDSEMSILLGGLLEDNPSTQEFILMHTRAQEVAADMGVATSPCSAENITRFMQRMRSLRGDGHAITHPSHKDRHELALAVKELFDDHESKKRFREAQQSSFSQPKRLSVRRKLNFDEADNNG